MRAIQIVAPHTIRLVDVPPPSVAPGEVLVRVQRLSLCGSDMGPYRRVAPEEEYPMPVGLPCHECAGIVEESRTEGFRSGDRVIVLPRSLEGGAEYLVAPPRALVPLPPEGDLATWVACQPLGTVLWGCQRYGGFIGRRVAVIGLGPIGLLWVACLKRLGAAQVIGIEPLAYRRQHGVRQGADVALDPAEDDLGEAVRDLTGGEGPEVVVEASGAREAPNLAIQITRPGGTIIAFGSPHPETVPVDYFPMMQKRLILMTSYNAGSEDPAGSVREAVALAEHGWIDLSWLVTHRLPFSEVARAFRLYAEREDGALKVVMEV